VLALCDDIDADEGNHATASPSPLSGGDHA
jgi:hypothetical protein